MVFLALCLRSLYLNPLSDVGKQSLYVRGVSMSPSNRQVKVLASVTEGSDISENWHPILSVIRENASSWDRSQVTEQLKVCTQRNGGLCQSYCMCCMYIWNCFSSLHLSLTNSWIIIPAEYLITWKCLFCVEVAHMSMRNGLFVICLKICLI